MDSKMAGGAVLTSTVRAGLTGLLWSSLVIGQSLAGTPAVETGCRQTNALTGIYVQPSLESSSRGILASGQTVRLETNSLGAGWARVTEPLIGWVEAKYLSPAAICSGLTAASPQAQATVRSSAPQAVNPAVPIVPPAMNTTSTSTTAATCDVLPAEGLIVRSEPTTHATALQTIPKGTYQFQFTSDHVRSHSGEVERNWTYITAPYQGWIAVGTVGGQSNLGGKTCG